MQNLRYDEKEKTQKLGEVLRQKLVEEENERFKQKARLAIAQDLSIEDILTLEATAKGVNLDELIQREFGTREKEPNEVDVAKAAARVNAKVDHKGKIIDGEKHVF